MMQKVRLKALLENLLLSSEIETVSNSESPKIKKELLKKHSEYVHQLFSSLLSEDSNTPTTIVPLNDIQNHLKALWTLIQGTSLSYTSIPETAVTKFLISVAYEALGASLGKCPSLMEVLQLLMPGLLLGELECTYTPRECNYELSDVKIAELVLSENQANNEEIIIQFLKTHLIADSAEYIIPLWALNKLGEGSNEAQINNVYYQYDKKYQAANPTQLTPSECTRLGEHNSITQSIAEIDRRLKGYRESKSNLLGQLTILSKSLYFNSIHGVGKEHESGATAELSIRRFFDYYATLDKEKLSQVLTPALQEQLMKLRHCIGVYYPGEPKITLIETCMATRREELQKAMQGQETKLASISPSEANLSQLLQIDQQLLKKQLTVLNQAIAANQLEGHERLPMTKRLIEHYGIALKVTNVESLTQLLNDLAATEIAELMTEEYLNNWSIAVGNVENLVILFLQLSVEKVEILSQHLGKKLKTYYLQKGKDYISLLLLLPEEKQNIVIKYFIDINHLVKKTNSEKNLLLLAVEHPELFVLIWRMLSVEQRLDAMKLDDHKGKLLHLAVSFPASLKVIFESCPEEFIAAVRLPDCYDLDMLHLAAALNPESLKIILEALPENERLEAVKTKNECDVTTLHCAVRSPESLKMILALYPKRKERLAALILNDKYGNTVLHTAAPNFNCLMAILELLPKNERLKALKVKDKNGKTVLHHIAGNPKSLKIVLGVYPPNKRLAAVKVTEENGSTVLHYAAENVESLRTVLGLYPKNEHLEAVDIKNKQGNLVLHYAANNVESLQMILKLYPKNERLRVVRIQNQEGRTALHCAGKDSESYRAILKLYPKKERLAAVKTQDQYGKTALHFAAHNPKCLKTILKLLPENDRLAAMIISDKQDYTILHCAANKLNFLKIILGVLPENMKFDAVKSQNKNGDTMLHWAMVIRQSESLKFILEQLPKSKRTEVVQMQNKNGDTVLHLAANQPECLKIILKSLPENKRLELIKIENNVGDTMIRDNAKCLKIIMELLPAHIDYNEENFLIVRELAFACKGSAALLGLLQARLDQRFYQDILYAVDHPYINFLYQHRQSIAMMTGAALAVVAAGPNAGTLVSEVTHRASSLLYSCRNTFFSIARENSNVHTLQTLLGL